MNIFKNGTFVKAMVVEEAKAAYKANPTKLNKEVLEEAQRQFREKPAKDDK